VNRGLLTYEKGIALYLQIAGDLEQAIKRRRYRIGEKLPNEAQLQKDYGVSKFTVREALKRLEGKGLVEKRHGVGTVVIANSLKRPINYAVKDLDEFIFTAQQARLKKLTVQTRVLWPYEAESLALATEDRFAVVTGMRILTADEEEDIAYVKVYVPEQFASVVDQIGRVPRLVSTLIEQRFGVVVDAIRQEIAAPVLDPQLCQELGQAGVEIPTERALIARRWYLDEEGEIIICTENIFLDPNFAFNTLLSRTHEPR
jgi:GntR family transcriptional regulator